MEITDTDNGVVKYYRVMFSKTRNYHCHSKISVASTPLNDQAYNCLIHFYKRDYYADLRWKVNFDGRQPLMEDDLRWKTTLNERRLSMEDKLR